MMKEIKILSKLELQNLYGWNVFRHSTDPKAKRRYLIVMAVWLLLVMMMFFYIGTLCYGLIALGLNKIVISYLVVIASVIIFLFGIMKAGSVIYAKQGYEILCALPLSKSAIVVSRMIRMYVEDLLLTCVVMIPGIAIYGFLIKEGVFFYLIAAAAMLFVPLFPLTISVLAGAVIAAVSSRMKHKAMMQSVLTIVFVVIVLLLGLHLNRFLGEVTMDMVVDLADSISVMIGQLYPPAQWIAAAIMNADIKSLLLCIAVFLVIFVTVIVWISSRFHLIIQRLYSIGASHAYQMKPLTKRSVVFTFYQREWRRYVSSSIYVTNTIMGPLLASMMSAAFLFADIDTMLASVLPIDICLWMPFAFAATLVMMPTTAVSISMEGKSIWIVKHLPIPTKTLLDSKILLNLSIMLPFYLASEVMLILAIQPDFNALLWLVIIPCIMMIFSCVAGISVNLHFCCFDWEKEEMVVKQSIASAIGGFAGPLVTIIFALVVLFVPKEFANLIRVLLCLIILASTMFLYHKNNQVELKRL